MLAVLVVSGGRGADLRVMGGAPFARCRSSGARPGFAEFSAKSQANEPALVAPYQPQGRAKLLDYTSKHYSAGVGGRATANILRRR